MSPTTAGTIGPEKGTAQRGRCSTRPVNDETGSGIGGRQRPHQNRSRRGTGPISTKGASPTGTRPHSAGKRAARIGPSVPHPQGLSDALPTAGPGGDDDAPLRRPATGWPDPAEDRGARTHGGGAAQRTDRAAAGAVRRRGSQARGEYLPHAGTCRRARRRGSEEDRRVRAVLTRRRARTRPLTTLLCPLLYGGKKRSKRLMAAGARRRAPRRARAGPQRPPRSLRRRRPARRASRECRRRRRRLAGWMPPGPASGLRWRTPS